MQKFLKHFLLFFKNATRSVSKAFESKARLSEIEGLFYMMFNRLQETVNTINIGEDCDSHRFMYG